MSSKINITIPEPCHENWQKMTPLEKGRFCDSCQKQVFDFTKSSDTEILKKFNSEKKICGKFLKTQLERDIVIQKKKSSFWIAGASGILSFLSLGNQEGFSQEVSIEQTEKQNNLKEIEKLDFTATKANVEGFVYDENNLPFPGVSVNLRGTSFGTMTDLDGKFSLPANNGDALDFNFIGYKKKTQVVKNRGIEAVYLDTEAQVYMGELIVVRKTFFGRIFHSIGNIFK